jgi:hypothetical protein
VDGVPLTRPAELAPSGVAAPLGLVDRMARTWRAPRAAVRAEIAGASEARLMFYALFGSALFTLATVAEQALNPAPGVQDHGARLVVAQMVAGLFFRPLALYGAAGLLGFACRAAGGRGSWRDTRVATFWSALVAAPAGVALAAAGAALSGVGGAPQAVAAAGASAGSLVWAALLAPALAEAHGFRSAWTVFGGLAAFALGVAALAALAG